MKTLKYLFALLLVGIAIVAMLFATGVFKVVSPLEGTFEIGGPDDTFYLQEVSSSDSTIRFRILDENSALALDASFKMVTFSRQGMYDSLSSFIRVPYGLKLRDNTVMPVVKIYGGYMKGIEDEIINQDTPY